MGETMVAPAGPEEPQSDSFFSRALGIFISPGKAFESIARKPDFLAPLIAMTVASIVLIEAMLQKVGAEQIIRQSLELSGRAARMTPEQVDTAVHKAAMFTAITMRVAGVLGVPIFILIIAAVGLFIANVVFGASASFKAAFSVTCYANLVSIVGVVLGLLIILFGDVEQFNPENPLPSTVGFFLNPRETSKALYVIASSFDIFHLWFVFLTSLGLSAATGKKVGTAAIFLSYLGLWILFVMCRAGIAAIAA
jgi:hypothetical protein